MSADGIEELRVRNSVRLVGRSSAGPERLQREASALAALTHPNIVTIHAVEYDHGIHFLTMELVDGKPLADLIPRTKRVRTIFSVTRDVIGPPRLTRDGRKAYYSRRVTEGDLWLLTLQ